MAGAQQRHDMGDRAWEKIRPYTIGEKGTRGGNARDTRQFINGVFWTLRTGGPGGIFQKRMEIGRMYTAGSAGGAARESGKRFWKRWWMTPTLSG